MLNANVGYSKANTGGIYLRGIWSYGEFSPGAVCPVGFCSVGFYPGGFYSGGFSLLAFALKVWGKLSEKKLNFFEFTPDIFDSKIYFSNHKEQCLNIRGYADVLNDG